MQVEVEQQQSFTVFSQHTLYYSVQSIQTQSQEKKVYTYVLGGNLVNQKANTLFFPRKIN